LCNNTVGKTCAGWKTRPGGRRGGLLRGGASKVGHSWRSISTGIIEDLIAVTQGMRTLSPLVGSKKTKIPG